MRALYNDLAAARLGRDPRLPRAPLQAQHRARHAVLAACRERHGRLRIGRLLEFYAENGPTGFCRYRLPRTENDFGVEGLPRDAGGQPRALPREAHATEAERATWERHRADFIATAQAGLTVKETLAYIRHPGWQWNADAS